jgi:hypothetical protein
MRPQCLPVVCAIVIAVATTAAAQAVPLAPPPATSDAAIAAKCKADSFARRPAGQMATTMRDFQIKRCIKNRGFLD